VDRGTAEPQRATTAIDAVVAAVGDVDRDWFGAWMRASRAAAVDLTPAAPDAEGLASAVPRERLGAIAAELEVARAPIDRAALVDAAWRASWPHDRLVFASSRLVRVADELLGGKKVPFTRTAVSRASTARSRRRSASRSRVSRVASPASRAS
jgi:2-succinyl-5-enolpyruvyl-6-hydroxy-3-cyclohexene-1-carboxylate synthase